MKMPIRRRYIGWLVVALFVLPLCVTVGNVYRVERQQKLDRELIAAVKKTDELKVLSLLKDGANANAGDWPEDNRPIWKRMWDTFRGSHPVCRSASTALACAVGSNEDTPFRSNENTHIIKALLEAGANANVFEPSGSTPLADLASEGSIEVVRLLLDHGAKVNTTFNDGDTALYCACNGSDDPDVVNLLVKQGANANAVTPDGKTALQVTAYHGPISNVRLLIDAGASLESRDDYGNTALYYAVLGERPECVRMLIARGAKVNVVDRHHETLIDDAERNQEIIRMLKKAGEKK